MSYFEATLALSSYQKSKIASAVRNKKGTTIRLAVSNLSGSDKILLSKRQINKIKKSQSTGTGTVIRLSKTQLSKQGGFLGALLGGLAASTWWFDGRQGNDSTRNTAIWSWQKKASKGYDTARNDTSIFRSLKPLSNGDIDNILQGVSNYIGTYSKDMLPKNRKYDESLVVNLEDYFSGGGTHWVAIYNDEYFDSFGLPPPLEIVRYVGETNLKYNSSQIQDMNSIMCGYYC